MTTKYDYAFDEIYAGIIKARDLGYLTNSQAEMLIELSSTALNDFEDLDVIRDSKEEKARFNDVVPNISGDYL